jgi:hypothetical protein
VIALDIENLSTIGKALTNLFSWNIKVLEKESTSIKCGGIQPLIFNIQ